MDKRLHKITIFLFKLTCLSLTVYMSVTQFLRYLDNNDKASVSFRQFNHSPRDKYPTYTICFENQKRREFIFNQTYLMNTYGIKRREYFDIISGMHTSENSKDSDSTITSDIDFEKATIHPEEIISEYFVRYNKGLQRFVKATAIKDLKVNSDQSWVNPIQAEYLKSTYNTTFDISQQLSFYKSYQDHKFICLTRNNTYRKDMVRSFERLVIWTKRMNTFDRIRIYFHHPFQGMRTFFERFHDKAYASLHLKAKKFNSFNFRIAQVSVLRKRHDANVPCKTDVRDDQRFFKVIFRKIPCIPPYWKIFHSNVVNYHYCKNSSQINKLWKDLKKIEWGDTSQLLTQPCDKMSVSTSIEKSNTDAKFIRHLLVFRFSYLNEEYQEIVNSKDFGLQSFWSNIGGFIGIFLGYSLLQTPDLFSYMITLLRKKKMNFNDKISNPAAVETNK